MTLQKSWTPLVLRKQSFSKLQGCIFPIKGSSVSRPWFPGRWVQFQQPSLPPSQAAPNGVVSLPGCCHIDSEFFRSRKGQEETAGCLLAHPLDQARPASPASSSVCWTLLLTVSPFPWIYSSGRYACPFPIKPPYFTVNKGAKLCLFFKCSMHVATDVDVFLTTVASLMPLVTVYHLFLLHHRVKLISWNLG